MFCVFVFVLLFITITEGYYDNVTDKYLKYDNSYLYKNYRDDARGAGREPRLISFETKDNEIEVSTKKFKFQNIEQLFKVEAPNFFFNLK